MPYKDPQKQRKANQIAVAGYRLRKHLEELKQKMQEQNTYYQKFAEILRSNLSENDKLKKLKDLAESVQDQDQAGGSHYDYLRVEQQTRDRVRWEQAGLLKPVQSADKFKHEGMVNGQKMYLLEPVRKAKV